MEATIQYIEKELHGLYPHREVQGFIRLIFEFVCGWSYTEQVLHRNQKIDSSSKNKIETIVRRLKKHEPIQYIFGETEFFGLKLKVAPGVLIPRPETEELVQWIIDSVAKKSVSVLDIGTGSGCIALALKKELENSTVQAVDFSEEALKIARENARMNKLDVQLFKADILNWKDYKWEEFDVIVSNPPYVLEQEKEKMLPNVLQFEPGQALFVPDNNPLVFYKEIISFAKNYLKEDGELFFEINEKLGGETAELMQNQNFKNVELKKDLHGKTRMLKCRKQKL